LLLFAVVMLGMCGAARTDEDTSAAMGEIFQSMRYLLPLSVDDGWRDAQYAQHVRDALETVAERASLLGDHGQSDRYDFRFLGHTLASDLREVLRRYDRAEFESARFLLLRATDYCVACHARLPSPNDSPLSANFVDGTVLARLPLEQRAHLEAATRRFDDALTSFEALFAAPDVHPSLLLGALTDYLIISIRVRQDFDRALATLEIFSKRPDLWIALREDVAHWLTALHEFHALRLEPPTLSHAVELIDLGTRNRRYIADRRSLVHYVLASSMLHRFLESRPQREELASAYYLLGLVEFQIGRDFWIAQGEMFLERAIRVAPDSPVAVDAYVLLEQEILLGYTGSSGLNLPDDERERLARLRALLGTRPETK
jgi:hypothetical protein